MKKYYKNYQKLRELSFEHSNTVLISFKPNCRRSI